MTLAQAGGKWHGHGVLDAPAPPDPDALEKQHTAPHECAQEPETPVSQSGEDEPGDRNGGPGRGGDDGNLGGYECRRGRWHATLGALEMPLQCSRCPEWRAGSGSSKYSILIHTYVYTYMHAWG